MRFPFWKFNRQILFPPPPRHLPNKKVYYVQLFYQYVQQRKKKDTRDIDNYRHGACNMSCKICYF